MNGPDGKPLSKRHGSTSVEAFRERGILPEALMNYLALLGWSKDAETTFLSKQDLVESFDVARVSRNPARFDTEKLEWMNNHYIQSLDDDDLAARCLHFLSVAGLSPDLDLLRRAMPLVKERMKTLAESVELLRFLFTDDVAPNEKATDVIAKAPAGYLSAVADALGSLAPWEATRSRTASTRAPRPPASTDEGVPAGPRRRDGIDGLAAAPGIARAARPRAHGRTPPRRGMIRIAAVLVAALLFLGPDVAVPEPARAGSRRRPRTSGRTSSGGGSRSAPSASARRRRTRGATTGSARTG